jgi:hypothetical protein
MAAKKAASKAAAEKEPEVTSDTAKSAVSSSDEKFVFRADLGEGLPAQVSSLNPDRAK